MGKCKDPKVVLIDTCFEGDPIAKEMQDKGHKLVFMDFTGYCMIISPIAQMTPKNRLAYVWKKFKDIVKEVACQ